VQISAAVGHGARIIIFDEPTRSLSQVEAEKLYQLIAQLKQRGVTCIYVSHRLAEIFRLCDHVTVLRDGEHVATLPIEGLNESELVRLMIGRPLSEYFPQHLSKPAGAELLRVEGLSCPGKFENISFVLRAGEIVGLAGSSVPADPKSRRRCSGSSATSAEPCACAGTSCVCKTRGARSLRGSVSCPRIANVTAS
jgi:ABC-type sugar transport system ATPase subunit